MVSSSELCNGEGKNEGRQQTLSDVMLMIEALCLHHGMSYQHSPPVQVSPGVWMFYAVEMNDSCKKHGSCRQRQHFAIDVGGRLRLG